MVCWADDLMVPWTEGAWGLMGGEVERLMGLGALNGPGAKG